MYEILGPDGANVLGHRDSNGNVVSSPTDATFSVLNFIRTNGQVEITDVEVDLNLYSQLTFTSEFGLGLEGMPFTLRGDQPDELAIVETDFSVFYSQLTFGSTNDNVYLDTSTNSDPELSFVMHTGFEAGANFTGDLGFLSLTATDVDTQFTGELSIDVQGGLESLSFGTPEFSGDAHVGIDILATMTMPGAARRRGAFDRSDF